ncbi:cell division ATP-binding protein FtsE [Acetivibrio sp. MSJd-27]|uniref:cell division ATP-binding protein FtsE n=1 Tax=Acetivibrio sp. MSJd-27 TaxID=2841523 RepID=UPI0015A958B8|nr:cell division ATP-binding protein FtsE [Acetivibrio sp. MSJd-27]MBU5449438.1 cell division ATP-binding protein FtsE [Acetivibrio sp. MSJd-27]
MIEFRNVSKYYENTSTDAIKNISLKIRNGEFVFIVGQSGAGKSTLTKLMIAEQKPTSGEVLINGYKVHELKRKEIPYFRRGIGMVFQDFRLLENKTVYENVAFAMQIVGATSRQVRRKVPEVLSSVGLAAKAKSYPGQLSGGEQQRVAVARALVNNPSVIIADEPTGNLDPTISKEILQMLAEINKNGTTVIVVTHDKELVNTLQKRVVALDAGQIVSDEERSGYIETAFLS